MSVYEALDRFVGAGILACAAAVGSEMPAGAVRDGAAFSRFLRERGEGAGFGAVLDALAHEIWLAQERLGFPPRVSESHAVALAGLLDEVRPRSDIVAALVNPAKAAPASADPAAEAARQAIRDDIVQRARAGGHFERTALIEDLAAFLIDNLLLYLVGHERLLLVLQPALVTYSEVLRNGTAPAANSTPAVSAAALPPPVSFERDEPIPAEPAAASVSAAPVPHKLPVIRSARSIQSRHGLSDAALRRFEVAVAAQGLSPEQRLERLDELATWLATTVAQLTRPGNEDGALRRLKADAAAALAAGEFERAVDLLQEMRRAAREGRRRSEQRLAEEMLTLQHQMAEEASAIARLAELALARFDYAAAAVLFNEAATSVPRSEPELELRYRVREADALAAKGEEQGDVAALQGAARAYREALPLCSRDRDAVGWALLKVSLANVLASLGWRDPAATELAEAVATYEEALHVLSRQTAPMRWAVVQLSRSAALIRQGEHAEREQRWLAAAAALVPTLEIFESLGATEYAGLARTKLRQVHETLNATFPPPPRALKHG